MTVNKPFTSGTLSPVPCWLVKLLVRVQFILAWLSVSRVASIDCSRLDALSNAVLLLHFGQVLARRLK